MNEKYILYLDMDGVLVDFEYGFVKLSNGLKSSDLYQQYGPKVVQHYFLNAGPSFWAELPWIHGGKDVWEAARKLFKNVHILSSAGTSDASKGKPVIDGKIEWLKKNMPEMPESNIHIVFGKHNKTAYVAKESILVDDLSWTITEWTKMGGYGILHKSNRYEQTIKTLEDISRPLKLSEILKRK